ncbi:MULTISPECIES: hypothetical protein [Microbacterium]|uniref:hypothetical protein n=1 Tax=Microbacterium TaxID=33882 RepID=UPI00278A01E0|nr:MULTISPECIES: hypothetical protein [Microbacterium]MDQ1083767.1 hypothetical protein [Microbacterium sp. SORGH_AS_0344]MDQ1170955.1 hypothetical protein [Microbacterium proteolyticum]
MTNSARFCGDCGRATRPAEGNHVGTAGGDINGGVYQAGGHIFVNPNPALPTAARYDPVPMWRSPLTLGVLSWLGFGIGLAGLAPLWNMVHPLIEAATGLVSGVPLAVSPPFSTQQVLPWAVAFVVLALAFAAVLGLRRVVKLRLRVPLVLGWAVSGVGGRITLEKVLAADCPLCGGRLRYVSKVTRSWDTIDAQGRRRRVVLERVPALECVRNPKHWYEVDPAEPM